MSAEGPGRHTPDREVRDGDRTVVVMDADGSAGVRADRVVGERWPDVLVAGIGMVAGGAFAIVGGIALLVLVLGPGGEPPVTPPGATPRRGPSRPRSGPRCAAGRR